MSRILHRFPGGVHPETHKAVSTAEPILATALPARLVLPMRQHIGQAAAPIVAVGEHVLKGQMIAKPEGYVSAAIHAPSSGTVTAIEPRTVAHPSGLPDLCIEIACDGEDRWGERTPLDYAHIDPSSLRNRLRDMGLAGLGGAVFPTFIKLNPGAGGKIPTLILNGAECEPWITCDDMLMRERAVGILAGAAVMRHMLHADEVIVGIEDNKPEAIAAMRAAARGLPFEVEVVAVPTCYPGGGGKQLTYALTGKEAPSGGRSTDVGVQVFNVGTAHALHRAVEHGEPMISRIVTVTGRVRRPRNFETLLGMPMIELLRQAGRYDDMTGIVMGGPMMGFDVPAPDVPVMKSTNCALAKSAELFPPAPAALPCIRCGECARACPVLLLPQELFWFAQSKNFGKAQEYQLFDCIECGCCSYVCPSHIPLVDFYRYAKSEIWARERDQTAADQARERHDFRQFRQEREKREKAEKLAEKAKVKKEELAQAAAAGDPEAERKKAVIAEALARARAQKAGIEPKNIGNLSPEQHAEIAQIEARRAKLRELAKQPVEEGGGH
jgi:electron transport complex protein RnfC